MIKRCLFLLFLTPQLFSLYMGNPSSPEIIREGFFFCRENWLSVQGGYQRDWVFDRSMKTVSKISNRLDDFGFITDQGILTLNLIDRIELYGSGGATRFHSAHRPKAGVYYQYETYDQLIWGLGFRAMIASWKGACLGFGGAYQRSGPEMKSIIFNGTPLSPLKKTKLSYDEWQLAFGLSYQIDIFIPYIGVRYSNARAQFKHLPLEALNGIKDFKVKNRVKFGMAIGTTLSNSNRFSASVEARLIDEQSKTLAVEVKL